ncbi:hypothetical protein N7520_002712 [Penicillium odoratum]|uniref:uncharacterized protein n=1 Tax=Penicillium odoratum TaxID=1167516 RepID=UPI002547CD1D|nr:uncharacterized protein N7520_002712 [Penicillium odoratum]KAJ5772183.1 hypothetical protein N7520_002712 [Penicillium odoratum]
MEDPSLWLHLFLSAVLVLLGGAFSGLTIALMTQDEVYLRVIELSGDAIDQQNAKKVLALLSRGKHWILVALLLGNAITSEALPVVLDQFLDGGAAVLISTALVVVFSDIIPQSACARHALKVGANMVPYVSIFMNIISPIAWPIAKLLDVLVGDHDLTGYKRPGLKALISLHSVLGQPDDRLNSDEVKIIHGALGMIEKTVTHIMTPMEDIFSLPADAFLDEYTMDRIRAQGYSRILVHAPDNRMDIVGVLLAKSLIKYNPKLCKRVCEFDWFPIPVIHSRTTCLNVLKIFQEGTYHMVIVSQKERNLVLGIVTREDILEELIGEDILDEFDNRSNRATKITRRMNLLPTPRTSTETIVEKPPIIAVSAPESEVIDAWVKKTTLPPKYGSVDYFNSAPQWKYIQSYLAQTRKKRQIETVTKPLETPYGTIS